MTRQLATLALILTVSVAATLCSSTAMAQFGNFGNQQIWVSFTNNTSRTITLFTADGENLGVARPGQSSSQIDFTRGERVAAWDAQLGRWAAGSYVINRSGSVSLTSSGWVEGNQRPSTVQRQVQQTQQQQGRQQLNVRQQVAQRLQQELQRRLQGQGQQVQQQQQQTQQQSQQQLTQQSTRPADAAAVARDTVAYLNQLRAAKGLAPMTIDARLVKAAERRANWMGAQSKHGLDLSPANSHFMTINGETFGMNKWAREAGYPIPARYGNGNQVESLYATGAGERLDITNTGRDTINVFTSEGPGGGHYDAIYSTKKHIGVGVATNAQGTAVFVSLLTASPDM